MLAYLSREQSKMRPLAITAAAGTVGVSWILHGWLQGLCVAIVATLFMFVVLRNTTGVLRWRIFQFYGRISYSLYIGHAVTGYALLHLIEPYTGRWLGMAVTFIAVTGIAMLYHRIGEVYLTHRMKTALTALRVRQSGPTVSTND
jgi:peptidoglycan/LPS O-acetylase OafA/YrhL